MSVYIGIDSGTQSTKALVVDASGAILGRGKGEHAMIEGLGVGHKEQHPADWVEATVQAVTQAMAQAGVDAAQVAGLGVSGQQHGFVPLDAAGQVIRPAKLWCDTATAPQAVQIVQAVGGLERCIELTGLAVPSGFTASKILWLRQNEPENYARLATVLLPHDYLNFWLTGQRRMEWGDASGTALMDVRTRQWRRELIDAIDPDLAGKLPELSPSWEPCGELCVAAAQRLGLPPGTLVASGGGDNMIGAIGTGNVVPGRVTLSLGTSGTIFAHSPQPVIDPAGQVAAFCDSTGGWLPLVCTMNVTVATELTRGLLGLDTARLNELAAEAPAGCGGLMLVPYFEGERTPDVPDGTGVLFGLSAATMTPAHLARAAMEGATLGLNYGLGRMRQLGLEPKEIRLTGGGSNSPLWRQIVADIFGSPVVCTLEAEGAALGAAAQACWQHERQKDSGASIEQVADAWVRLDPASRCEPVPANAQLYAQMQARHDALAADLRPAFARHRAAAQG